MGCTLKYTPKSLREIQQKRTVNTEGKPKVIKEPAGPKANVEKGRFDQGPIHIIDQQILEIDGEFIKITMLGRN